MKYLILLVVLLSGCATTGQFERNQNAVVGKSESMLIARLGTYDSILQLPNGDHVIIYSTKRTVLNVGYTQNSNNVVYDENSRNRNSHYNSSGGYNNTSTYQQVPTTLQDMICITNYIIHNGVVIGYSYKGNDCRALWIDVPRFSD